MNRVKLFNKDGEYVSSYIKPVRKLDKGPQPFQMVRYFNSKGLFLRRQLPVVARLAARLRQKGISKAIKDIFN